MHKESVRELVFLKRVGPTFPSGWSKATNSNTHFLRLFLGTSKRAYAYIPESDLKSKLR